MFKKLIGALKFLTVLPLPGKGELEGASAFFPVAGWILGGTLFVVNKFLLFLPDLVRAFLILFLWECFSRGLHIDALADAADAFISGGTREKMLKVMSEPQIGAFGACSIFFLLTGKLVLISSLGDLGAALICSAVFSRYALTLLSFFSPPAKDEGLGRLIISGTGLENLLISTLLVSPLLFIFPKGAGLSFLGMIPAFFLGFYATRKLKGLTGDVLGASLELAELAVLFLWLFFLSLA